MYIYTEAVMTPEQFKEWREALELTQEQAADLTGFSKSSIHAYETGKKPVHPSLSWICAATYHNLSPWQGVPDSIYRPGPYRPRHRPVERP